MKHYLFEDLETGEQFIVGACDLNEAKEIAKDNFTEPEYQYQLSEFEALFDFYNDILTYDSGEESCGFDSKEIYIKKVSRYFDVIPEETTAAELVRAVFNDSINPEKFDDPNPTIVLGYVKPNESVTLFSGNLSEIPVKLGERDKLILFASH